MHPSVGLHCGKKGVGVIDSNQLTLSERAHTSHSHSSSRCHDKEKKREDSLVKQEQFKRGHVGFKSVINRETITPVKLPINGILNL